MKFTYFDFMEKSSIILSKKDKNFWGLKEISFHLLYMNTSSMYLKSEVLQSFLYFPQNKNFDHVYLIILYGNVLVYF